MTFEEQRRAKHLIKLQKPITMKRVIEMYKNQRIYLKKNGDNWEMTTNYDMGGQDIITLTKKEVIEMAIKDAFDYGWSL